MALRDQLERWISGLRSKVANMVLKALIQSVDDTKDIQLVHVTALAGEEDNKVERVQNYGFTSSPPEGSEVIMVAIGGNRDHPVVIVADSGEHRKKGLASSGVAMYHKDGAYVYLKNDGTMEIKADGKDISIIGGKVIADASIVQLGGTTGLKKLITEDILTSMGVHTHLFPATPPNNPTGPPTYVPPLATPGIKTVNTEAK